MARYRLVPLNASGLTSARSEYPVQLAEPARARAVLLVLDWRSTWLPSVTTDQLPPEWVQLLVLPEEKSSLNRVLANATPCSASTAASAAAARAGRISRDRGTGMGRPPGRRHRGTADSP